MFVSLQRSSYSLCFRSRFSKLFLQPNYLHTATPPGVPPGLTDLGRRIPHSSEKRRKNILEETKVQEYLEHIASTSQDVTLADIERHRPLKHAPPSSSKYEKQYNALVEALVRSFSSEQLRKFLVLYHLSAPHKRTKWELASLIIERRWKWPSLEAILKKKRDWSDVVQESFPLDAKQSFLILGKDGAHLLDLSSEFDAHISFSVNPLCLKVEGLRGSIDNFRRHVEDFKAAIQEERFQLPPGGIVKPGSLQHISRLSGVFLEDMGHFLVRVSHRNGDSRAVHFAKRLILQRAFEATKEIATFVHSVPIGAAQPNATLQPTYSLYPFFPSHSDSRIFDMSNVSRIRRSRDWLSLHLAHGLKHSKSIAEKNSLVNIDGTSVDLRAHLVDQIATLRGGTNSKARVTASFGHHAIGYDTSKNIISPLNGTMGLGSVLDWLQSNKDNTVFIPSLPPLLINNSDNRLAQQHLIHRLVYHSLTPDRDTHAQPRVIRFELVHGLHALAPPNTVEQKGGLRLDDGSNFVNETAALESKCWIEATRQFNVAMPDRPIDVQFRVSADRMLSQGQWPENIGIYSDELGFFLTSSTSTSPPATPLTIMYDGVTYRLESSSTVRQNLGHINWTLLPPPETIIEAAFEQESGHRSKVCKIICADIQSNDSWDAFIEACDIFTLSSYSQMAQDGEQTFT